MKVIVIGGGAAGMMAAIAAAQTGADVTLLERNEKLGKKIYITGKGRCNYTNSADTETSLAQVMRNRKFLYSAFYGYTSEDVTGLLEANGCPTKEERGQRRFPVSDHASDVTRALERAMKHAGVRVHLNTRVTGLIVKEGAVCGVRCVQDDGVRDTSGDWEHSFAHAAPVTEIDADAVILATGGLSYPSTGSTGDGYAIAQKAGHKVTPLRPSLTGFVAKEDFCRELAGLAPRNVRVRIRAGEGAVTGKVLWEDFGELLFTHRGVSGPLMLTASAILGDRLKDGPLTMTIDWKPALTDEQLDARLLREIEAAPAKNLHNLIRSLLPASAGDVLLRAAGLSPEKKAAELTRAERTAIVRTLRAFPVTLTALGGFSEAVITCGGVNVKEVDSSTMESKLVRGLFFAGEVLDVDALTGGFNLQIAWSTGHLAGISAAAIGER